MVSGVLGRGFGGSILLYRVLLFCKVKEDSFLSWSKSGFVKIREKIRFFFVIILKESVKEWWDVFLRMLDILFFILIFWIWVMRVIMGIVVMFKFDVLEYLFSSFMCFVNFKNFKLLGKGVCVVSFELWERGLSVD